MRKNKFIILLCILIFFGIIINLMDSEESDIAEYEIENCFEEELKNMGNVYLKALATENKGLPYDISSFSDEENNIYILLPNSFEGKELKFYVYTSWDEIICRKIIDISDLVEKLCFEIGNQKLNVVRSNIPVIFLNADQEEYRNFDKVISDDFDKDLILNTEYYIDEKPRKNTVYNGKASIHLRGNGTAVGPTKPYSLKLDNSRQLIGDSLGKKWNLLANWQDKTLLKNDVFFELARKIGVEYTPTIMQVSLYINGYYQGVYSLTSKINVSKNTINLGKGDFLVNWGDGLDGRLVYFDSDSWFSVTSPDKIIRSADIVFPENDSQDMFIQEKLQLLVDTLEGRNMVKLGDVIDIDSFARFYWVMETSMDWDAGISTYSYYKKQTDKLYMGPVWDMDITLGATEDKQDVEFFSPYGFKVRRLNFWKPFFQNADFLEAVNRIYFEEEIYNKLLESYEYYETEANNLGISGEMNFLLRRDEIETYGLHYDVDSYREQVDEVLKMYSERIEWINDEMLANK